MIQALLNAWAPGNVKNVEPIWEIQVSIGSIIYSRMCKHSGMKWPSLPQNTQVWDLCVIALVSHLMAGAAGDPVVIAIRAGATSAATGT